MAAAPASTARRDSFDFAPIGFWWSNIEFLPWFSMELVRRNAASFWSDLARRRSVDRGSGEFMWGRQFRKEDAPMAATACTWPMHGEKLQANAGGGRSFSPGRTGIVPAFNVPHCLSERRLSLVASLFLITCRDQYPRRLALRHN
jgi:hypothetical protein